MLEILERILSLEWRRQGASIRELALDGCKIWYAEFSPDRKDAGRAGGRPSGGSPRGGRSPTLILLHGLGASASTFHPLLSRLRGACRLIAPDLPGHGRSPPPDGKEFLTFSELLAVAEHFVETVAPAGAYLAGNSMGGWIATKLAARRPDLVHGICLLNPGGPALHIEDWVEFTRLLAGDEAAVRQYLSRVFHRPPFGASLFSRDLRRMIRAPRVADFVRALTPEDFLDEEEIARVSCPSVLVWGQNDRLIPEACRSWFLENLRNVRYEPMPDCGHCPQIECPGRTADILLKLARAGSRHRAVGVSRAEPSSRALFGDTDR